MRERKLGRAVWISTLILGLGAGCGGAGGSRGDVLGDVPDPMDPGPGGDDEAPVIGPVLDENAPIYVQDQVLLRFQPGMDHAGMQASLESILPSPVVRRLDSALDNSGAEGLAVVSYLPGQLSVDEAIARVQETGAVLYAEPDYVAHIGAVPDDSRYSSLWGMPKISAPAAWDLSTGDRDILVSVIDTGIDHRHADLAANMWRNPGETPGNGVDDDGNGYVDDIYGYDFVNRDGDPLDDNNHGTHCAGTIGGVGNDGNGVAGVNWRVSMAGVKFLSASGGGSYSNAIAAVNYSTTIGAHITSNSWSGGYGSTALRDAFAASIAQGVIHIAAAGNSNNNNDTGARSYPCSYDLEGIICVAASDSGDRRAGFSSYGVVNTDLAAPGVGILSTVRNGGYSSFSGTSMATPHVAGAAALVLSLDPTLDVPGLRSIVLAGVDSLSGWSGVVATGGRLNARKALETVRRARPVAPANVSLQSGDAAELRVTWNRAAEPDVVGYKVYYGTTSGNYGAPGGVQDAGNVSEFRLGPLELGRTWYVAVTAYTAESIESAYSSEASAAVRDTTAPAEIFDLMGSAMVPAVLPASIVSSSGSMGADFPPGHLVDGNPVSDWVAPLRQAPGSDEVVLRLAEDGDPTVAFSELRLVPSAAYAGFFPKALSLHASDDGLSWTSVFHERFVDAPSDVVRRAFPSTRARFVKLTVDEPRQHSSGLWYAAIGELELRPIQASGAIRLGWTAPGDNGTAGTASIYDLRISTTPPAGWNDPEPDDIGDQITDGFVTQNIDPGALMSWFAGATPVSPQPSTLPAGTQQFHSLSDLDGETAYYVALRAEDLAGNQSHISQPIQVRTLGVPPAPIGDLQAVSDDAGNVTLSWTAPGDDGHRGRATRYGLRVSDAPITDRNFADALAVPIPAPADAGADENALVPWNGGDGLDGTRRYYALVTWDEADERSGLSNVPSVVLTLPNDDTPPEQVTDLRAFTVSDAEGRVDIAGVTATQSDTTGQWPASAVTDDDPATAWSSTQFNSLPEDGSDLASLTLDLGEPVVVGAVSASALSGLAYFFPSTFVIEAQTSSGAWVELVTGFDFEAPRDGELHRWDVAPTRALKIRMRIQATPAARVGMQSAAMVSELVVHPGGPVPDQLAVTWIAPRDTQALGEGQVVEYDLRVHNQPLNPDNFASARRVAVAAPQAPGSLEAVRVGALQPETDYWFGLIAYNAAGLASLLSNVALGQTPPVPPGPIGNFRAEANGGGVVALHWLAPGDDGLVGSAARYELRYATSPITNATEFEDATRVAGMPVPQSAGSAESVLVESLQSDTHYHFALIAYDDRDGATPMTTADVTTPDETAPDAPLQLTVVTPESGHGSALAMHGAESSGSNSDATSADAAVDGDPATAWITPRRIQSQNEHISALLGADSPTSQSVSRVVLLPSADYADLFPRDFVVELSNDGQSWNAVGSEQDYVVEPDGRWDLSFSAQVANRVRVRVTESATVGSDYFVALAELQVFGADAPTDELHVSFISPGDDGASGTPTLYELRYLDQRVDDNTWAIALPAAVPPPVEGGLPVTITVRGLQPETRYWFAARAVDEANNSGAISNSDFAQTLGEPPARVDDLGAAVDGHYAIDLSWTAPGDDGDIGMAHGYDLRRSTSPIDASNFRLAQIVQPPTPLPAGSQQTLSLSGLTPDTTYYFALKAVDPRGNWSAISNLAQGHTVPLPEAVPPAQIADLSASTQSSEDGAITLSWTAPGDDGNLGRATSYELRMATQAFDASQFASQTLVNGVPAPSSAGASESFVVRGLDNEQRYYFAIRALDEVPNTGAVSSVVNAETRPVPPAQITDLTVVQTTGSTLTVELTAPGGDGNTGQATRYHLRWSESPISESNWNAARPVAGVATPLPAGATQSLVVNSLPADTLVYVAVKAEDDQGYQSPLSNVAQGRTSDGIAPSPVNDLSLSATGSPTDMALAWSATGDNGSEGQAASYELRYAAFPITSNNFSAATLVGAVPTPGSSGSPQAANISGLRPETQYYAALRVTDESGNVSDLSNVASARSGEMPPSAVRDLVAVSSDFDSVSLIWTATGDNGDTGRAASYDLRYSTAPLGSGNFASAIQVDGEPTPSDAGVTENFTVTGLDSNTTYYFLMRVVDARGNESPLSNQSNSTTLDDVAPAEVDDLRMSAVPGQPRQLEVRWTAVGDDGSEGTATRYDLRYSTSEITENNFGQALSAPAVSRPRGAGNLEVAIISNLDPERRYWVALVVEDDSNNRSGVSNVVDAVTGAEPPTAVANLAVVELGQTDRLELTWSAPQDNGPDGRARNYLLRYATDAGTVARWTDATPVSGLPTPGNAGASESLVVTGLDANTRYFFAIRSEDELDNLSGLSNIVSGATADPFAPSQIVDLAVRQGDVAGTLVLSWTAPGDDADEGQATRYELRYADSAIESDEDFEAATPVSAPTPRLAGQAETVNVTGLEPERVYHFAVIALDEADNAGALSNTDSADTGDVDPSSVVDLVASGAELNAVTLNWSAPGDDGGSGTVTDYDVRYSTSEITANNFEAASRVEGPAPVEAGGAQTLRVTGLVANTDYWFALIAEDERGNRGGISNVVTLQTLDPFAPDAVDSLRASAPSDNGATLAADVVDSSGQYAASWRVEYAVDGNRSTVWASPAREASQEEYITVDLGVQRSISEVRLAAAEGYAELFPKSFDIQLATDPLGFSTVHSEVDYQAAPRAWNRFEITPTDARFVRIRSTESRAHLGFYYVMLSELAVVATPAPADTVQVRWLASGDDGDEGTATRYDLRYVTGAYEAGDWDTATQVSGLPTPQQAGLMEQVTVTGLMLETEYSFVLRVYDEADNDSGDSNVWVVSTRPVPPDAITDLSASLVEGGVQLSWTAPGDPGHEAGAPQDYEIRYLNAPITTANWDRGERATLNTAAEEGATVNYTVGDLAGDTTWYFAVRGVDVFDRMAELSNVVSAAVPAGPDTVAPAAIDSLTARAIVAGEGRVWPGRVISASSQQFPDFAMDNVVDGDLQTDWAIIPSDGVDSGWVVLDLFEDREIGLLRMAASATFESLFPGAVSIEGSLDGQAWTELYGSSNPSLTDGVLAVEITPVTARYLRVTGSDLATHGGRAQMLLAEVEARAPTADAGTVVLSWVAPGDDGSIGTATAYDLRYSTTEVEAGDFDNMTAWPESLDAPQSPGSLEGTSWASGLSGATLWFAIIARDEAGNEGDVVEVVTVELP